MFWNAGNAYTCDFNFLEMDHTNFSSSIQKIAYQALNRTKGKCFLHKLQCLRKMILVFSIDFLHLGTETPFRVCSKWSWASLLFWINHGPPRGLSTPIAPEIKLEEQKIIGREIGAFLTDLHHTSYARSCNRFLWFPHTPKPPWPLKWPKHFNLLLAFSNFYFFRLLFRAHLGYGYTSCAGAITVYTSIRIVARRPSSIVVC